MRLNHLSRNPAEVQETFLVPFSYFQTHQPITYTYPLVPQVGEDFPYDLIGFPQGYPWRGATAEVPIYLYEGRAIWGLTDGSSGGWWNSWGSSSRRRKLFHLSPRRCIAELTASAASLPADALSRQRHLFPRQQSKPPGLSRRP